MARSFHPSSAPKIDPGSKVRVTPTTPTTSHAEVAEPLPPNAAAERLDQPPARRERRWPLATVVALVLAAGIAFAHFRQPPPLPPQAFRVTLSGPPGCTNHPGFAISPDGKSLVTVTIINGKRPLWLRALDGLEIKFLPSTNGVRVDATISEEVGQIP